MPTRRLFRKLPEQEGCQIPSHRNRVGTQKGPSFESQHCGSHKADKLKETLKTCLVSLRKVNRIAACPLAF